MRAIEAIGDRYFSSVRVRPLMAKRPIGGRPLQRSPNDHTVQDPDRRCAFATIATAAFSQVAWEFNPGMTYMYAGPGKMSAMAMASDGKNHDAMMKQATKVPANTAFFMHNNELYSVSGTLDPTGNFYRQ